jgi:hypothetical protein
MATELGRQAALAFVARCRTDLAGTDALRTGIKAAA